MVDLFPGFAEHRVRTSAGEIYARVGGHGAPVLLLHGFPQTHVCWHKVAPALACEFTLVAADLRGYGQSFCPRGDGGTGVYSKRAMAVDMLEVMRALGHHHFAVVGHDRGGRVAYRMALDHPQAVRRLAMLDILPTLEVWQRLTLQSAVAAYHWTFLAQPHPLPETLIAADPSYFVLHTLESWTAAKSVDCFDRDALAAYRAALEEYQRVHAVCEDYRAGADIDCAHDAADRAAGVRIACPTQVLWGTSYVGKGATSPLAIWKAWCKEVEGQEIASGHFLLEEHPEAAAAALLPFLRRYPGTS